MNSFGKFVVLLHVMRFGLWFGLGKCRLVFFCVVTKILLASFMSVQDALHASRAGVLGSDSSWDLL